MRFCVILLIYFLLAIKREIFCFQLPQIEYSALQSLYNATNGSDWNWNKVGDRWDFTNSSSNPCNDWQGVFCNSTCEYFPCVVSRLLLPAQNLQGYLPEDISNLKFLLSLDL
jgi:hypothetical protein